MHAHHWRLGAIVLLSLLPVGSTLFAQEEADLRKEIEELKRGQQALQLQIRLIQEVEALKKGQEEIRSEIADIKKLLQQAPSPAARAAAPAAPAAPDVRDMVFDVAGRPSRGDDKAPLTLVEFTDFQCPYCARYVHDTSGQLEKEYVDSGKLRFVKMDLPLSIHPQAYPAALAAHCAQEQGKFWEMHDRLFANQQALEPLKGHAEALGLDVSAFESCMSSQKYAPAVRADMVQAARAGATGTPSFVLCRTDSADPGKVKGITLIRGARPFADFKAEIDKALAEPPPATGENADSHARPNR